MPTRSDLIVMSRNELGELGAGVSQIDTALQGNHFHFAINQACSRVGIGSTDADLANADNNTMRLLSLGVQYYVTKALVKAFISIPRLNVDQVSRDNFARVMELLRFNKQEFEDAISGNDIPPEINRPAFNVVTWASPNDGAGQNSREGNNFQKHGDFYIGEFGEDRTTYEDDGE